MSRYNVLGGYRPPLWFATSSVNLVSQKFNASVDMCSILHVTGWIVAKSVFSKPTFSFIAFLFFLACCQSSNTLTAHFVFWRVFFGIESISIECSCSVLFWRAKVWRLHNSTFSQLRKMNKLSPWLQNYPKLSWVYVNKSQSCKKAFQTNKQASKTIALYWCKHSYKFPFKKVFNSSYEILYMY